MTNAIEGFCKQCRFRLDSSSRAVSPEYCIVCHLDNKCYRISFWTKMELSNFQHGRAEFVKFGSETIINYSSKIRSKEIHIINVLKSLTIFQLFRGFSWVLLLVELANYIRYKRVSRNAKSWAPRRESHNHHF